MNPVAGGAGVAPPPPNGPSAEISASADSSARHRSTPLAANETIQVDSTPATTDKIETPVDSTTAAKDNASDQPAFASQKKASSATCIPRTSERTKIYLPSHRINGQIQYMRDHVLIGNLLGLWPTEKAL